MKNWLLIFCLVLVVVLLPIFSFAADSNCLDNNATAGKLCNPTAGANIANNNVIGIFPYFIELLGGFVVGMSIVYILFSGFRMIVSQGNTEEIEKSKITIQWVLIGFSLSVLAYVLVAAFGKFLGVQDVSPTPGQSMSVGNPLNSTVSADFSTFVHNMEKGVLEIVGVLAIAIIIISGFRYVTARGNEQQTEQAKAGLQWAVIGLVIALLAYVIVAATSKLLGYQ